MVMEVFLLSNPGKRFLGFFFSLVFISDGRGDSSAFVSFSLWLGSLEMELSGGSP